MTYLKNYLNGLQQNPELVQSITQTTDGFMEKLAQTDETKIVRNTLLCAEWQDWASIRHCECISR